MFRRMRLTQRSWRSLLTASLTAWLMNVRSRLKSSRSDTGSSVLGSDEAQLKFVTPVLELLLQPLKVVPAHDPPPSCLDEVAVMLGMDLFLPSHAGFVASPLRGRPAVLVDSPVLMPCPALEPRLPSAACPFGPLLPGGTCLVRWFLRRRAIWRRVEEIRPVLRVLRVCSLFMKRGLVLVLNVVEVQPVGDEAFTFALDDVACEGLEATASAWARGSGTSCSGPLAGAAAEQPVLVPSRGNPLTDRSTHRRSSPPVAALAQRHQPKEQGTVSFLERGQVLGAQAHGKSRP